MKKIIILRSIPRDAAFERIALALSTAYRVECWVWDRQGDYAPAEGIDIGSVVRFRLRSGYHSVATLLKLVLFQGWLFLRLLFSRYDAVHAIDLDTGIVALAVASLRHKPFVYHCLDPYAAALPSAWPRVLGILAKNIENFVISRADIFVVTDLLRMPQHEGAKPRAVIEFANVPHRIPLVPAPVDASRLIIGYIGSLIERRNLRTIIEVAGTLEPEGVRLIIGGFGPLEQDIRGICGKYGNVEFIGWIPYQRVLEVEAGFDVMIHMTDPRDPGQRWVSPNKLFESMALGKPIITAEGTLAAERANRAGNGKAILYGSREALRSLLIELREYPERRAELGERGKSEYERTWNFETMKNRLLDAYRKLLPARDA